MPCSGGTIDINVSEVVEVDDAAGVRCYLGTHTDLPTRTHPLSFLIIQTVSLSELTVPSGGPFGGTAVDREFTSLLSSCAGKKRIPPSAWLGETRRMFLAAKVCLWIVLPGCSGFCLARAIVSQESYDFSLDAEADAGTPRAAASYTVDITDVLEEWGYLDDARESEFKTWKERVIVAAFRSGKVMISIDRYGISSDPVASLTRVCLRRPAMIRCFFRSAGAVSPSRWMLASWPRSSLRVCLVTELALILFTSCLASQLSMLSVPAFAMPRRARNHRASSTSSWRVVLPPASR